MLVSLDAGGSLLTARITRLSFEQLALRPGLKSHAQIKAVSVLS
jgi:molybdate transport system ATP-binding protein